MWHLCPRISALDKMLQELDKEIQPFKLKNQANIDDMKNNVAKLSQITASLEAAVAEQEVRWFGV